MYILWNTYCIMCVCFTCNFLCWGRDGRERGRLFALVSVCLSPLCSLMWPGPAGPYNTLHVYILYVCIHHVCVYVCTKCV